MPLALTYVEKDYKVIGIDIDKNKLNIINQGKSYIKHIADKRIKNAVNSGNLSVSSDFSIINKAEAIILCVPTPLNINREPDLSYINSTMESLLDYLKPSQILSLESTTYPGTTEENIRPRIEAKGLKVGEDIFLVYSPEREDPGNKKYKTSRIPKVLGGSTTNCAEAGKALYGNIIDNLIEVSSTKAAEMTKLLENIHRAVNIGLINELKILSEKMDFDLYEVINAAATKPFGFSPYYPGPGLGGHCIPIDPFYLTWKAREYGMRTRFIELAGEINSSMPQFVVRKTIDLLNNNSKSLKGSNILILGLAYKKNIDDMRESPSLDIIFLLQEGGANIKFNDPYITNFPANKKYNIEIESIDLTKESLNSFDIVILSTDHDDFDYNLIQDNSKLIIDTRGKFTPSKTILRA